jgi:hypothetical protein
LLPRRGRRAAPDDEGVPAAGERGHGATHGTWWQRLNALEKGRRRARGGAASRSPQWPAGPPRASRGHQGGSTGPPRPPARGKPAGPPAHSRHQQGRLPPTTPLALAYASREPESRHQHDVVSPSSNHGRPRRHLAAGHQSRTKTRSSHRVAARFGQHATGSGAAPSAAAGRRPGRRAPPTEQSDRARSNPRESGAGRPRSHCPHGPREHRRLTPVAAQWRGGAAAARVWGP